MICRMWHGWTSTEKADAYEAYLKDELFARLERELSPHGYLGYELLRRPQGNEVEFVTMLWFESLEAVRTFAGANYEMPVISERARALLYRYAHRVTHYQVRGSSRKMPPPAADQNPKR
jgi:antibiotic biosynthesis monooxygenase (ABM) superfamily enzyme